MLPKVSAIHQHTAVTVQVFTLHKAGCVRGQEQHTVCNLFRCCRPVKRHGIQHLLLFFTGQDRHQRRLGIGGAQAVAALAYGTEQIPKVDKIVGPGNIYVAIFSDNSIIKITPDGKRKVFL